MFGAGTDYALLLVARYREELRRHTDRHEAMAIALRRAGPAIVASASTVIAGLLCLLIAESNSTRGLGPVAAIGIVVGLASMLTLLPALLVIAGRWIFLPYRPSVGSAEPTSTGAVSYTHLALSISIWPPLTACPTAARWPTGPCLTRISSLITTAPSGPSGWQVSPATLMPGTGAVVTRFLRSRSALQGTAWRRVPSALAGPLLRYR